ncbi:OsmC family protein [Sphingomonas sp. H39-1-10]|uniref:OsmC family protein n=1 Tax=Sphingomonas pollutisoli TaxID=3030829 RepID=UPI0023B9A46E|nr:OsmC family protein [Sphingomonas pollutisoli]MDF0490057.1 OsmC family protein [Sphingomonas pollutisoli]
MSANRERSVVSEWRGGLSCEVQAGRFTLVVDEPENVGGTDRGPQPTELFLSSIASCFTLALAFSARNRSVVVDAINVTATGIYDGPRFSAVRIDARVACDPAALDGLIRQAQRVCYVTNTLKSDLDIVIAHELIGT